MYRYMTTHEQLLLAGFRRRDELGIFLTSQLTPFQALLKRAMEFDYSYEYDGCFKTHRKGERAYREFRREVNKHPDITSEERNVLDTVIQAGATLFKLDMIKDHIWLMAVGDSKKAPKYRVRLAYNEIDDVQFSYISRFARRVQGLSWIAHAKTSHGALLTPNNCPTRLHLSQLAEECSSSLAVTHFLRNPSLDTETAMELQRATQALEDVYAVFTGAFDRETALELISEGLGTASVTTFGQLMKDDFAVTLEQTHPIFDRVVARVRPTGTALFLT